MVFPDMEQYFTVRAGLASGLSYSPNALAGATGQNGDYHPILSLRTERPKRYTSTLKLWRQRGKPFDLTPPFPSLNFQADKGFQLTFKGYCAPLFTVTFCG